MLIGDTLVVDANATGGSLFVEALDPEGDVIKGFSREECAPITSESLRHVVKWNNSEDCYPIQARPIKLRFYLKKAKLCSFEPRISRNRYIQAYD